MNSKIKENLENSYNFVSERNIHSAILYFAITAILLIPVGGVVSSTVIGAIALVGLSATVFDSAIRRALLEPTGLRPLAALLGLVLLWQILGLLLRSPSDMKALSVLGSAFGIAMLLPVVLAAARRDAGFRSRFFAVLFTLGCIAAAISILRYVVILGSTEDLSLNSILRTRLVPFGRASHQILGSGGLAASFFAGLAFYPKAPLRQRKLIVAGLVAIALTIALTQSRGPMLGILLAISAIYILERLPSPGSKTWTAFALTLLCFFVPVGLVAAEPWVKDLVCDWQLNICRPSNRQDVWATVLGLTLERPWFGIGPTFRFPDGAVSHPHNGLLGLIFFFGFPMGLLFIGIIAYAIRQALAAAPSMGRTFALLGIFFSASFMATDLSNPFAFVNTHYLYLWLPVFIGAVWGDLYRETVEDRIRRGSALNAST